MPNSFAQPPAYIILRVMKHNPQDRLTSLFNLGDTGAFNYIYELYLHAILNFTKNLVIIPQEAEDITSETFIKLWKLRGHFESQDKILAFLHITAKNACLDYLRHLKLKSGKEEEIIHASDHDDHMMADDMEIRAAFSRRISAEIEKLPRKCRRILKLSYLGGLKNEQIAERLHISEKTVRNQKAVAIARLRMNLEKFS